MPFKACWAADFVWKASELSMVIDWPSGLCVTIEHLCELRF